MIHSTPIQNKSNNPSNNSINHSDNDQDNSIKQGFFSGLNKKISSTFPLSPRAAGYSMTVGAALIAISFLDGIPAMLIVDDMKQAIGPDSSSTAFHGNFLTENEKPILAGMAGLFVSGTILTIAGMHGIIRACRLPDAENQALIKDNDQIQNYNSTDISINIKKDNNV